MTSVRLIFNDRKGWMILKVQRTWNNNSGRKLRLLGLDREDIQAAILRFAARARSF